MDKKQRERREVALKLDTEELKAKQSVRTTFKLPEKTINLVKVSARHIGIKQKTLLDQLLEDEESLALLAEDALSHTRNENACRPKTFVLSKKALDQLEDVSCKYERPRDVLFELSVARLASYVDALAATHETRRALLHDLQRYQKQLDGVLGKGRAMLESEDAFLAKVEQLAKKTEKQIDEIGKTVKQSDEFDY